MQVNSETIFCSVRGSGGKKAWCGILDADKTPFRAFRKRQGR